MIDVFDRLIFLEKEATDFGFKWENTAQILAQIQSEVHEVDVHLKDNDQVKLQEEIGDLLHAVYSLCIFCKFNLVETLEQSLDKFEKRFHITKQLAAAEGLQNLNGQKFEKLMALWEAAKRK